VQIFNATTKVPQAHTSLKSATREPEGLHLLLKRVRSGMQRRGRGSVIAFTAARRVALVHATQGGLLLLFAFGVLLTFPKQLLGMLYGSGSDYLALSQDIRLFTLAYFFFFIALVLKFLLKALQETRGQLISELFCCCLLLLTIVPLVSRYGLVGCCASGQDSRSDDRGRRCL